MFSPHNRGRPTTLVLSKGTLSSLVLAATRVSGGRPTMEDTKCVDCGLKRPSFGIFDENNTFCGVKWCSPCNKNTVVVGFPSLIAYNVDAQGLGLVWWMQKMYGWYDGATRALFNLATEGSIT